MPCVLRQEAITEWYKIDARSHLALLDHMLRAHEFAEILPSKCPRGTLTLDVNGSKHR